jgi:2-polyprenyl-3-methyl-5-hydroxy-6-metoxy-1,4-benzoquinol methylase
VEILQQATHGGSGGEETSISEMDRFLPAYDNTANFIAEKALELFHRLKSINADSLGMPDYCLQYFKSSHTTRLFFSIETSAHLLYRASKLSGRPPSDLVITDYGAGVGTLFLLAKLIGCRFVIYNDHLNDWRTSAELVARAVNVHIDMYVVGDIEESLKQLDKHEVRCDVITSRNVLEHIYKLDQFFHTIYLYQPQAIVISSTTANHANPASVIKHMTWHRKWEKIFRKMRLETINRMLPELDKGVAKRLAAATRGNATSDLESAILAFRDHRTLPQVTATGTNTCDPSNGVWAENLLTRNQYRQLIDASRYEVIFVPGFWDTHYSNRALNYFSSLLNRIIRIIGSQALFLAPFIYVIAKPKNLTQKNG